MTTTTASQSTVARAHARPEPRPSESTSRPGWISTVLLGLFILVVAAMVVLPERGDRLHRGRLELLALEAAGRALGLVESRGPQTSVHVVAPAEVESR
ncbi:MAG: hypothetical protein HY329_28335 [Chloroflexi bacterium]|nr:hypothetical protein [Chloroflexota bacterium]